MESEPTDALGILLGYAASQGADFAEAHAFVDYVLASYGAEEVSRAITAQLWDRWRNRIAYNDQCAQRVAESLRWANAAKRR